MDNWFYMDRITFENVLYNELGVNLTGKLLSIDFDLPVSFLIGETSDEILIKIQQIYSHKVCGKIICNENCISCAFNPPTYAKLAWFVQRLLIMRPIRKAFIKQKIFPTLLQEDFSYMKDDKNLTNHTIIPCDSTEENSLVISENKNDRNIQIQDLKENRLKYVFQPALVQQLRPALAQQLRPVLAQQLRPALAQQVHPVVVLQRVQLVLVQKVSETTTSTTTASTTSTTTTTTAATVTITSNICTVNWSGIKMIANCVNCSTMLFYYNYVTTYTAIGTSTRIAFSFRRNNGYFALDNLSVRSFTAPSTELLVNGGFEMGDLTGWSYCSQDNSSMTGGVKGNSSNFTYLSFTFRSQSGSYYYVGGGTTYADYISQTFSSTIGALYTVSLWILISGTGPLNDAALFLGI
ncbi:unnamed protein product [Rotaria sordida]|uniref:Uncharacterized protein n=1 Tax=Rotaria sordida TaxID=392033 RepID=A0A819CY34_9BILA|nr:unnamed protein product [Rotaria sordida]